MQVSLDIDPGHYRIHGYDAGHVVVSIPVAVTDKVVPLNAEAQASRRERIDRSLIIHPEGIIRDWAPQSLGELRRDDLAILANLGLEILILGTGQSLQWPEPELLAVLQTEGIGVEVMDTGAACRTYNILVADQRRVAAALIIT